MVDRNLIESLGITDEAVQAELDEAMGGLDAAERMDKALAEKSDQFQVGRVLKGRVVNVVGNDVFVEVGLKSEGVVDAGEFDDRSAIEAGEELEVLLEAVESDSGLVVLSKRKADRIRAWERIIETKSRHPPPAGHRRIRASPNRGEDSQDRSGREEHRGLAAQAHRGAPQRG